MIENDGNASALAEARTFEESRCVVVLTLGTGVGGGVVVDGQLLLGASGLAAELGHLSVGKGGPPCVCGGRGCLELFASGPAIARAGHAATSAEVVAAADAGDATAQRVLRAAGAAIGRAIVLLIPVVDPDLVLITGRLADAAGALPGPCRTGHGKQGAALAPGRRPASHRPRAGWPGGGSYRRRRARPPCPSERGFHFGG